MLQLLDITWLTLRNCFKKFVPFFIIEMAILSISPLSEMAGLAPGSGPKVWIDVLAGVLAVWNFVFLIHVVMGTRGGEEDTVEQLINAFLDTPRFILQSLLLGITILLGGLLFILPGLYFLVVHYFAPVAAIIDPDKETFSYLSYSRSLVNDHRGKVFLMCLVICILAFFVPFFSFLPFLKDIRLLFELIVIPIHAIFTLYANLLVVEFYYFLRASKERGFVR